MAVCDSVPLQRPVPVPGIAEIELTGNLIPRGALGWPGGEGLKGLGLRRSLLWVLDRINRH